MDSPDPTPDINFIIASERYLARVVARVTAEARVTRGQRAVREGLAAGDVVGPPREAVFRFEQSLRAARADERAAQEAYEAALLALSMPRKATW